MRFVELRLSQPKFCIPGGWKFPNDTIDMVRGSYRILQEVKVGGLRNDGTLINFIIVI